MVKEIAETILGLPAPPTPKKWEAPRKQLPRPPEHTDDPDEDDQKDAFGVPPRRDNVDDEIPF